MNGLEASAAAASYDSFSGRLSYGKRFTNGLDLLVSGTLYDSAGHDTLSYPEFRAINGGVAEGLDGESAQRVFLSLGYKGLSLAGAYSERKKEVPTAPYAGAVFNRGPNYAQDERDYLELKYAQDLAHDWRVLGRVFLDRYRFDGVGPFYATDPPDPDAVVFNEDLALAHFWGGEVQASKALGEKHQLTFGGEFRDDWEVRQRNRDREPPFTYGDVRSDGDNFGLYAQDEFALRTNLLLTAGVRYDHFPTFHGTVNPRAGLIYSPVPPTTLKLLYGQAYRAPNAYEADYRALGYDPNPDLDPERIRSYEIVWEQQLSRPLRLSASFFFNDIEDLITQQLNPATDNLIFRNTEAVRVRGAEAQLDGRWSHGLRGRVSYTFAEAWDESTGARLNNAPRHVGKLSLVVPLYAEKIFAGLEVQGMTARRTVQGTDTDGFAVANFTLFSRKLVKNLEASVSLYNLWNQPYADPVGPDYQQAAIRQDGRTFRVKVTYRF
jgi:iron complex outermembrane receptor protein